jgi:hypothetical protein
LSWAQLRNDIHTYTHTHTHTHTLTHSHLSLCPYTRERYVVMAQLRNEYTITEHAIPPPSSYRLLDNELHVKICRHLIISIVIPASRTHARARIHTNTHTHGCHLLSTTSTTSASLSLSLLVLLKLLLLLIILLLLIQHLPRSLFCFK